MQGSTAGKRTRRLTVAVMAAMSLSAGTAGAAPTIPPGEILDRDAARVVRQITSFEAPPIPSLSPANARQLPAATFAAQLVQSDLGRPPAVEPVRLKSHVVIPGPGGDLVARVYSPTGSRRPRPVLVYFPGGGWTISSLQAYAPSARALANASGFVVVLAIHRLAPENKFPAAAEDANAVLQYVQRNTGRFGGIPGQVAVGGESAGGNLAAVATLMARDRGGVPPIHQLLVYPITNFDFSTRSYSGSANNVPLDRPTMEYFWAQYLASPADGANPYASPLRADLKGLPSATVITAQNDPLRSEGQAYARKLTAAGVNTNLTNYRGVMHEFLGMGAVIRKSRVAVREAARDLRRAAAAAR